MNEHTFRKINMWTHSQINIWKCRQRDKKFMNLQKDGQIESGQNSCMYWQTNRDKGKNSV